MYIAKEEKLNNQCISSIQIIHLLLLLYIDVLIETSTSDIKLMNIIRHLWCAMEHYRQTQHQQRYKLNLIRKGGRQIPLYGINLLRQVPGFQ